MPKWFYHKNVAKVLCLSLSEKVMNNIDSILDGIKGGYEHDFWKHVDNVNSLRNVIAQIYASYGVDGVKYCLLHILLDTFQASFISEMTRETPAARMKRDTAHKRAFEYTIAMMEYTIEKYMQEYKAVFEQFLNDVKSKQEEIMGIIKESSEVKAQVQGIEKFKEKHKKAEKIARRYMDIGYDIPFYTQFILELWNDRKRGVLTKEEWANKVLAKYKRMSKGLRSDVQERRYNKLVQIAKDLGYIK